MCAGVFNPCIYISFSVIIPIGSRAAIIEISVFPNVRHLKAGIAQQVDGLCLGNAAQDGERQTSQ